MANRIITALDVGSTKICAAIASVEEGQQPKVIGVATYPSEGLKKGTIVDIDDAINSIAACLEAAERMAGITVSSVYLTINGKDITSTNNRGVVAIAQDEIVTDDVFRAIESARTVSIPPAREILHVIPREFIVDAQSGIKDPVGMTGTRLEVDAHIISATSTSIHNLIKSVQQLGLRIDDIVFTGWASSTAVLTPTERELGVMMIDMGGGTTSINTFVDDAITYSGCVPFGGVNVTSDLAIGLRVSLEDAEKIKVSIGDIIRGAGKQESEAVKTRDGLLEEETKERRGVKEVKKKKEVVDISALEVEGMKTVSKKLFDEIVEARMVEIFSLVINQLEQSRNEYRLPAGVVITGGSAMLPRITAIAKEVFGAPARIGSPNGVEGLIDEIASPAYAASQGLILYGALDEGGGKGKNIGGTGGSKQNSGGILGNITGFIKNLLP
ncbi:cell division protein FtsA [Candidatus Dojkabacteria bacterium]|nr:cell division protein FtsA [Candidatus Dojkabacteria bacterium]